MKTVPLQLWEKVMGHQTATYSWKWPCVVTQTHSVAKSTIKKNIWSEINIQWKQNIFYEPQHISLKLVTIMQGKPWLILTK